MIKTGHIDGQPSRKERRMVNNFLIIASLNNNNIIIYNTMFIIALFFIDDDTYRMNVDAVNQHQHHLEKTPLLQTSTAKWKLFELLFELNDNLWFLFAIFLPALFSKLVILIESSRVTEEKVLVCIWNHFRLQLIQASVVACFNRIKYEIHFISYKFVFSKSFNDQHRRMDTWNLWYALYQFLECVSRNVLIEN